MNESKADIRRRILARRDALTPEFVARCGEDFARGLSALPVWRNAAMPAAYVAFRGEAETRVILEKLFSAGRAAALPRVVGSSLRLHRIAGFDQLAPGKFGIAEPLPYTPEISPAEVDCFLAPGVAFDPLGARIGFGKGHYDRLLAGLAAPVIGLAYDFQILPRLPEETHDRRMDFLATPSGVLPCDK